MLADYYRVLDGVSRPRFKSVDLAAKIRAAWRVLESCELCERKCGAERLSGEVGECRAPLGLSVSSTFEHRGEESFFVPSFTVFFYSCTFHCKFCQNHEISQVDDVPAHGFMSEIELARRIDAHAYCRNVNFVGGEPTPYLPFVLRTLDEVSADVPVVWNSNFYQSERAMRLLSGVIDVYLSDFKFGNDRCAQSLSGISGYWATVSRNHVSAFADAELVVRHLVMPGHIECCTKPVLGFLAEHFGDRVVVNLMDQYRPCYRAEAIEGINRRITPGEFQTVLAWADDAGLSFVT